MFTSVRSVHGWNIAVTSGLVLQLPHCSNSTEFKSNNAVLWLMNYSTPRHPKAENCHPFNNISLFPWQIFGRVTFFSDTRQDIHSCDSLCSVYVNNHHVTLI